MKVKNTGIQNDNIHVEKSQADIRLNGCSGREVEEEKGIEGNQQIK